MTNRAADLAKIRGLLQDATQRITMDYFQLPVATSEGKTPLRQFRERVYAYELYHQLRSIWPQKGWPYSLGGEVDKRAHPLLEAPLGRVKPDLLVHVPGGMENNLLVIEIKANVDSPTEVKTDLEKLDRFVGIGYSGAIFLAYGGSRDHLRRVALPELDRLAHRSQIEIWHHPGPGDSARALGTE